jgi:hypothetical protein
MSLYNLRYAPALPEYYKSKLATVGCRNIISPEVISHAFFFVESPTYFGTLGMTRWVTVNSGDKSIDLVQVNKRSLSSLVL